MFMLRKRIFGTLSLCCVIGTILMFLVTPQVFGAKVNLRYVYPVELAGPLAKIMDGLCKEFSSQYPEIKVTPIYGGSYWESTDKVRVMVLGGNSPDVAVLCKTELFGLRDIDAIMPLDKYVERKGGEIYLSQFIKAFLLNSWSEGKIWSIPFQSSAPLLYYNKDAFREAGLDPNRPPDTWDELTEYAKTLTIRDQAGNIVCYGLEIPVTDHWLFGATVMQNGGRLENELGNEVYYNDEVAVESLQWWVDLVNKWKVMPPFKRFGIASADFVKRATAMMYNSTGSLTFVRENAPFDLGVAFLPKKKRRAVYSGGGTLYIFKDIQEAHKEAAWEFLDWMTAPDITARWCQETGYLAVKWPAWDLTVMKQFVKEAPEALVALKELKYATREFMPHSFPESMDILVRAVQDALAGTVSAREALETAQKKNMEVLAPFRQ